MSLRPTILLVHRWLTFTVGALFVLIAVSGSLLVFRQELDVALEPALFAATPGDVGVDSVAATIRAAEPDRTLTRIWLPRPDQPVYVGELAGRRLRRVHVDPGTGRVLGVRGESAIALVRRAHVNLFGAPAGTRVVGLVGALLLVMAATGLWLWWPGLRRLARGFRVRWRTGAHNVNYDLHNIAGVVSLPVVAITALTGVLLAYGDVVQGLIRRVEPQTPAQRATLAALHSTPTPGAVPRPLDDFVRTAAARYPGYTPMLISLPGRPTGAVQVRMWHPDFPATDGIARLTMDQYTGRVLQAAGRDEMGPVKRFHHTWTYPLHVGTPGGAVMRWLWFVLGMVPAALAGTGLYVWWSRRAKRQRLAARRSVAPVVEERELRVEEPVGS